MTSDDADPVVSALAELSVPAPAGLRDTVFTDRLAAPSRLGEVSVEITGAGADAAAGNSMFGPARRKGPLRGEDANLDEVAARAGRGVRYLGNGTTGVVCFPACRDARRITPGDRRGFRTLGGAARATGYRPCRTWRPAADVAARAGTPTTRRRR